MIFVFIYKLLKDLNSKGCMICNSMIDKNKIDPTIMIRQT